MSNQNGVQMDGVVFVKNVLFVDSGMRIFVDYKQKEYKKTRSYYALEDGTMGFQETVVRTDTGVNYEGLIHINYGSDTFQPMFDLFKQNPIMTRNGFPMYNWVFSRGKLDVNFYSKGRKITKEVYTVLPAGLDDGQCEALMIRFAEQYPNYMPELSKRFKAQLKENKFITIQERYNAFKDRGNDVSKGPKVPSFAAKSKGFTKKDVTLAKKPQLQTWCKEHQIKYTTAVEARRLLFTHATDA